MGARILVVDDDPNIREVLGIHLRNAGYEVATAKDGIEAGYGVLRSRPDLIIADVEMPHMTGFELVAALRADNEASSIPVILFTSQAEWEDRGKQLGAVGYVTKPILVDQLLSVVAQHVERSGSASAAA